MSIGVSDHALLRFLERAGGLDIEELRVRLTNSLVRAHAAARTLGKGDYLIRSDGLLYVVRGETVTTVVEDKTPRPGVDAGTVQGVNALPGILADIAEIAGEDAALAVAASRGGTQVYIPPSPDRDHWLSRLVGQSAAKQIADRLTCGVGGMRVDLPLGPKGAAARLRAKVDRMIDDGRSERDIALATGYTIRGVRRRKARRKPGDDRQFALFR
jgi:hypothetical protein